MNDPSKRHICEEFDSYYLSVRRFLRAIVKDGFVADDLTQETFERAQRSVSTFRDGAALAPWLMKIAYNLSRDHFRKVGRAPIALAELQEESFCDAPVAETALERRRMSLCVQKQIQLLPHAHRIVLYLYEVLDFDQKEIAEVLDITVDNVKITLHRGRRRLRSILERNCTFERDERDVFVCIPKLPKR